MFESYEKIFEQRGDAYHTAMTRWPEARREEFQAVLDRIDSQPGIVLLDMPSGGGYLRNFLPQGTRYLAFETSAVFHEFCLKHAGMEAILGQLDATGLGADCLDRVVSLAGMHHVANRARVYAEVERILRPGGLYLLADAVVGSPVADFLNIFVHAHNSQGHEGVFLDDSDTAALIQARFQIVSDEIVPYPWRFASENDMVSYCKLLFGMDRLPSLAAGLEGIHRHLAYTTGPDGCAMNWGLRFVVARKADADFKEEWRSLDEEP